MGTRAEVGIREAAADDTAQIASLHADSWRRHYRGAYSASYLDSDLDGERLAFWRERLVSPRSEQFTLVACRGAGVLGFVHVVLDADPTWGALVENLHVTKGLQRAGIGTRLLSAVARRADERRPERPLYLWVLEQNTSAQAFYRAQNGELGDREPATPPQGDRRNLEGTPFKIRVSWSNPRAAMGFEMRGPRS